MIATSPEVALQGYYALHSKIYDATRWSFLFGRERILQHVAAIDHPKRILEVGCGWGGFAEAAVRAARAAIASGGAGSARSSSGGGGAGGAAGPSSSSGGAARSGDSSKGQAGWR